jgi:hypothetical protein
VASDLLFAIRSGSEATVAAHLAAAHGWGVAAHGSYDYLKGITAAVLVVNGSNDIVVATVNSYILQQNLLIDR